MNRISPVIFRLHLTKASEFNSHRLKMEATDGKKYLTDAADSETLLRLIQSVPSPKAEPIKIWLAKVGYERLQDMSDPARSLDRVSTGSNTAEARNGYSSG